MDTDAALDAIVLLRSIWDRQQGHVTLADLDLVLIRCVRSRGHAALPPERWRRRPWASATRHEWSLEA
jgi:hypothetical protein